MKLSGLAALLLVLHSGVSGQDITMSGPGTSKDTSGDKINGYDEIVIKRKSDKDVKITVEIKDGQVLVNGKPASEFNDDNVSVRKKKIRIMDGKTFTFSVPSVPDRIEMPDLAELPEPPEIPEGAINGIPAVPGFPDGSPFRENGGTRSYGGDNWSGNTNRALLGVTSGNAEKEGEGAKIKEVAKGSAAEKAGLQTGDLITKVDEITISGPEALSKAVRQYKPGDKITLAYQREGKINKTTAVLGKSKPVNRVFHYNYAVPKGQNFDFKMSPPGGAYGEAFGPFGNNRPRLGIRAQDIEEGKGAKVLDVSEASAAEKAGIKEGDIITRFDGKEVNNAATLADLARESKDKTSLKISLIRDGKSREIEVKIPRKLKTADL
ncbi:PDZ domain-containing protein [Flavitalea flava]